MKRTRPKEEKKTKQLGIQIDVERWRRFRMLAIKQDRTATELMEEAMAEYLERHGRDVV